MKRLFAIVALVLPLALHAQENLDATSEDDCGLWFEAEATKKLSRQWSLNAGLEMRLADNMSEVSRASLGASVDYKPASWVRLSAGYEWINGHTLDTKKKDLAKDGTWNGYNYKLTPAYWKSKHRVKAEAAFQLPKLWHCIRVSVRERYQWTWRSGFTVDRWAHKFYSSDKDAEDAYTELTEEGDLIEHPATPGHKKGEEKPGSPEFNPKYKSASHSQFMRTRVKVAYEKKRCRWNPFVAYEFYNDLESGLEFAKTRLSLGADYKISKQHEVGLSYLFSTEYESKTTIHSHIINISYGFKF